MNARGLWSAKWLWLALSLLAAVGFGLALRQFAPAAPPPPEVTAPPAALKVPALRRFYLPDQASGAVAPLAEAPVASSLALDFDELAQFQSTWRERLQADLRLLRSGAASARDLPLPEALTQFTGALPDLRLQRQESGIHVSLPAQQRALGAGTGSLLWQGLDGEWQPQGEGWQLRVDSKLLKLADLHHGWLTLERAQAQADLSANLQPSAVSLHLDALEVADGAAPPLKVQEALLEAQIPHWQNLRPAAWLALSEWPQALTAHARLRMADGVLEMWLRLDTQPALDSLPARWEAWLPLFKAELTLECDQAALTALSQFYHSGKQSPALPLNYLQTQGYLQQQADRYRLHLRWQEAQLWVNETRIGSYADYQLAQQQQQIGEAFSLLAGLQEALERYHLAHGRFPRDLQQIGGQTQGKFTQTIQLDSQAFSLQAHLQTGARIELRFLPQAQRWECSAQQLPARQFAPAWCQAN